MAHACFKRYLYILAYAFILDMHVSGSFVPVPNIRWWIFNLWRRERNLGLNRADDNNLPLPLKRSDPGRNPRKDGHIRDQTINRK